GITNCWQKLCDWIYKHRITIVVYFSMCLDQILMTSIVPIIPNHLFNQETKDNITFQLANVSTKDDVGNDTYEGIEEENGKVGWLLSSKAIVQFAASLVVGPLTNRVGYSIPLFTSTVILFICSCLYSLGEQYWVLFLGRSLHGLGSAFLTIGGFGIIADTYQQDAVRSKYMGVVLGGLALGVIVGYPFGSVIYNYLGKTTVYAIQAIGLAFLAIGQFVSLEMTLNYTKMQQKTSFLVLLKDPYIMIIIGSIFLPAVCIAMLEATLTVWVMDKMSPEKWLLGVLFLSDGCGYFIGSHFAVLALKVGRWVVAICGLLLCSIGLIFIPMATTIPMIFAPHFAVGMGSGVVDAALMPMLALLLDTRYFMMYGSVYTIAELAFNAGYAIGPSVGGQLVNQIGFSWLLRGLAIFILLYLPLIYFLRDPPGKEPESTFLTDKEEGGKYNANEEVSPNPFNYGKLLEDD
ncbi:unnamed protein product, partial [Owenia fusiformis]